MDENVATANLAEQDMFGGLIEEGDYDVPPGEELWGLLLVIALNKIRTEETFHRAGKRDVRLSAQPARG